MNGGGGEGEGKVEPRCNVLGGGGTGSKGWREARKHVLERCVHRLEHLKLQREKEAEDKARRGEADLLYQAVDWHDFVVAETIDFDSDDEAEPEPEPASASGTLAAKTSAAGGSAPAGGADTGADADAEQLDVRHDYVPRVGPSTTKPAAQVFVDHRGRRIAEADMSEHMRIELLDPRWRQENARRAEKNKETSFASGEAIAANLGRFAQKRADIFATSAEEDAVLLQQRKEREARSQQSDGRVIWDGHMSSGADARAQAQSRPQPAAAAASQSAPAIGPASSAPAAPLPPLPLQQPAYGTAAARVLLHRLARRRRRRHHLPPSHRDRRRRRLVRRLVRRRRDRRRQHRRLGFHPKPKLKARHLLPSAPS